MVKKAIQQYVWPIVVLPFEKCMPIESKKTLPMIAGAISK
jgi:hypothetical protein